MEEQNLQVELILGLPWIVGYAVEPPEEPPVVAPDLPSPPAELTDAQRDWTRWGPHVLTAGVCWILVVGVGAMPGLIPLGVMSWQLAVVAISAVALVVALVVTCPKPAEQDMLWGSEQTTYSQCTPSRIAITGRRR